MVVGDHELDTGEAALAQPQQKFAPARTALALGELDREDAPAPAPADAERITPTSRTRS